MFFMFWAIKQERITLVNSLKINRFYLPAAKTAGDGIIIYTKFTQNM